MRKTTLLVLIFLSLTGYTSWVYCQQNFKEPQKLIVFHSPACHRCIQVKSEIMPEIEKEFKGRIEIEYLDISHIDNYKLMIGLKEKYNPNLRLDLPVFFLEGRLLSSNVELKDNLRNLIIQSLYKERQKEGLAEVDLVKRFLSFTPLAVISAGLIDGINPCAFTVIVFFISFLALQGYRKKELITIGLSFIFAVFLTYLLLGLGIFNFLYHLKGFWLITKIFNISIGIFSITLGILALYDFFKFKKTRETEGLILQLPKAVKNRIYSIIGLHYRKSKDKAQISKPNIFRLVLSAFITGFLVSIFEAICTGQLYLPTISFVLKTTDLKLQALVLLLLYNIMFVVPLFIIFSLALLSTTSGQFAKFLKRHLASIKILMSIIFFGLGIYLIWRA
jgi:cytochrome c biogenesis protein CcdA